MKAHVGKRSTVHAFMPPKDGDRGSRVGVTKSPPHKRKTGKNRRSRRAA